MGRQLSCAVLLFSMLAVTGEAAGPVVLYSNGPIVNLPGGGAGGAHASRVQGELGMSRLSFGQTVATPSSGGWFELADEFTVETPGGWHVTSITIYTIPFATALTGPMSCFGGPPNFVDLKIGDAPGSASAGSVRGPVGWVATGVYRVISSDPAMTGCPIYATTVSLDLDLAPGTYFASWQLDNSNGSFLGSLPGAVPVTRTGATTTGDAQARIWSFDIINPFPAPGPWFPLVDVGGQGLAFEVRGTTQNVVKGNLDGQKSADLLLRNTNAASPDFGRLKAWLMNGTVRLGEAFVSPDPPANWTVVGSDDFDSWSAPGRGPDGQTDLAFYNEGTGQVAFWLMDGLTRPGAPVLLTGYPPPPLDWRPVATGDFDEDGAPDLIWRSTATRKLAIWRMNGTNMVAGLAPQPNEAAHANWVIVAALDYNGDGHRDLLWYNVTSGNIVTWYLNAAAQRQSGQFVNPPSAGNLNWKVVAGGDYSWSQVPGTPPLQAPDIVWRNETSGNQVVWHMGTASNAVFGEFTNPPASTVPLDWTIVGPR